VTLTIQYRHSKHGAWKTSAMPWSFEDVAYLNRACGYEKYRVARVTA
jgi:hypothetical protein